MLRSMYSGISGMRGFQTKLDVIGNNIANVNTVGFKAGRVMFDDVLSQTVAGATAPDPGVRGGVNPKQVGLGVALSSIDTIFTQGYAMTTNVPTDVRIDGDGFFAVMPDGNAGTVYLTRAGNFKVDSEGYLTTAEGDYVLDVGGAPIQIPANTPFEIAQDGGINTLNPDGTIDTIAQIGLVVVPNPGGLKKIGGNKYEMTLNSNPGGFDGTFLPPNSAVDGTGALIAGQLEMSNVDLTNEFTEMIVAQRGFQANSRIITTSDEILQEIVNLKR